MRPRECQLNYLSLFGKRARAPLSLSLSLSLSLCEVMFEDQAREVGWRKSGLDKTLKFAISTALDWIKCFASVLKLRLYFLSLTLAIFFFEIFRIFYVC